MPKVSINILTRNRADCLRRALASAERQSFRDFEVVVVNDGSEDGTSEYLENQKLRSENPGKIEIINHGASNGITQSRQEALEASKGEYIAILDDDDEWVDMSKLKKQVEFLDNYPEYVLVGGGIRVVSSIKYQVSSIRPESDQAIRRTMLFRNNFFTSTVMFRRETAVKAGGFIKDEIDLAEDYDLWLRLGKIGRMRNSQEVFTQYSKPDYNKEKFRKFLEKQLILIGQNKSDYPYYYLARLILQARYALQI